MLKDLKIARKEKRRCAKAYDDWRDNEYNCGPLKYVIGVQSNGEYADNFNTLNDLDIYFNRDTKKYLLSIDTTKSFVNIDQKRVWVMELFKKLRAYMYKNGLFCHSFYPFELDIYKDGQMFIGDSLTELYYKFGLFAYGFNNL